MRTGAGVGQRAPARGGLASAVPLITKGRNEAERLATVDMNYFLGIDAATNRSPSTSRRARRDRARPEPSADRGTTAVTSNVWHHAAATYDGTTWKLYLDGRLDASLAVGEPARGDSIQHAALGTAMNSTGVAGGLLPGRPRRGPDLEPSPARGPRSAPNKNSEAPTPAAASPATGTSTRRAARPLRTAPATATAATAIGRSPARRRLRLPAGRERRLRRVPGLTAVGRRRLGQPSPGTPAPRPTWRATTSSARPRPRGHERNAAERRGPAHLAVASPTPA